MKILNTTKHNVENKVYEILPIENIYRNSRIKRGLINGLGSVFKAITGNLDASDGERFEDLIQKLSSNQGKLQKQILETHSVSHALINKFNDSLNQIYHHEETLRSKMLIIQLFINNRNREISIRLIKDVILELVNLYQIINQQLQDIENSITFSKLGSLHPSIVTQKDLFKELIKLNLKQRQLPFGITLENMYDLEKIIKISGYIYNNKITFILAIPVSYETEFSYYELIPVPKLISKNDSLFSTIIPSSRSILRSKMYYAYNPTDCTKLQGNYFCGNVNLRTEPNLEDTCEMSILTSKNTNNKCKVIQSHLAEPIIYQLESNKEWIAIFPNLTRIKLQCQEKQKQKLLHGAYTIKIPPGCKVDTPEGILTNQNILVDQTTKFEFEIKNPKIINTKINLTMEHLKNDFKGFPHSDIEYIENINNLRKWNIWDISSYIIVILIIFYVCYKLLRWTIPILRKRNMEIQQTRPTNDVVQLPNVQLPGHMVRS